MAADYDKLVVALEARVTDFERNLKRANSTATKQFRQIEKSAEGMTGRLGAINSIGSKAFTGLGTVALAALAPLMVSAAQLAGDYARAIGEIVDSFRDLENQSTRGLNSQLAELGGQCDLTTVTAEGVCIETLRVWPDVVGEKIQPGRLAA